MKIKNFTPAQKKALTDVVVFSLQGREYGSTSGKLANVLSRTGMCTYKQKDWTYKQHDYITGVDYNKLMLHPQGFEIMQEAKENAGLTIWQNESGLQSANVKFKAGEKVIFCGYYGTNENDQKYYQFDTAETALTIEEVILSDSTNTIKVRLSNGFVMTQLGYVYGVYSKANCLAKF